MTSLAGIHATPRDHESLRNKFKGLKNCSKPTGNPNCPEGVRRAKRAQLAIEGRMSVSNLDDDVRAICGTKSVKI